MTQDGSKDPITCRAAAAVYIPQDYVKISKRVTDHISEQPYR